MRFPTQKKTADNKKCKATLQAAANEKPVQLARDALQVENALYIAKDKIGLLRKNAAALFVAFFKKPYGKILFSTAVFEFINISNYTAFEVFSVFNNITAVG